MPAKKTAPSEIYQIKVTLRESKPPIWRRLLVKPDMGLSQLHEVLQIVMGWQNSHLHEFEADGERYGSKDFDELEMGPSETHDEAKAKLRQVLYGVGAKMVYTYDFGDNWAHLIVLEKILPAEPGMKYPAVTAGKRNCPPEDCGGIWGYYDFLEAISDPKHPEHESMLEWIGGRFDPDEFSVNEVNVGLHGGWPRQPD